jgi:ABC-type transport system substrate-binding protein
MSTGPKKRFGSTLTQPVAPTPDELMFGTVSPLPVPPAVGSIPSPPAVVPAPAGPTGRWVPFGSYVRDQTYLLLKQAEYWEPGFEIRQFLEDTLQAALAQLPAAQRPLPEPVLEKLLKTNRKLRPE